MKNKCKWTADPTAYSPRLVDSLKEHSPTWKIGTGNRTGMAIKSLQETPSPFAYTMRSPKGKMMHLHTITDTTDHIRKKNIPGPGTYADAQIGVREPITNKSSPKYKMGSETGRFDKKQFKEQSFKPGPGAHTATMHDRRRVTGGGFGTSTRTKLKQDDEPGPGSYALPAKIGDIPVHALTTEA